MQYGDVDQTKKEGYPRWVAVSGVELDTELPCRSYQFTEYGVNT
jgi:hypothetical protein